MVQVGRTYWEMANGGYNGQDDMIERNKRAFDFQIEPSGNVLQPFLS